jgi:2',3'-cyclic-nucleotide 2'-phosphodiesterase (5'-nucleotidase family)
MLGVDIMLTASGGIRSEHMGPLVTYRDVVECCSFDEPIFGFKVTGAQLKSMMLLMMRKSDDEEHNEFYQISKGLYIKYDRQEKRLLSLQFQGRDVQDSEMFSLAMHQYHYLSIESFLGVSHKELEANGKPHVIATSSQGVLEEYFLSHALVKCPAGARIEYGE